MVSGWLSPDSIIGTDTHIHVCNALGVFGTGMQYFHYKRVTAVKILITVLCVHYEVLIVCILFLPFCGVSSCETVCSKVKLQ